MLHLLLFLAACGGGKDDTAAPTTTTTPSEPTTPTTSTTTDPCDTPEICDGLDNDCNGSIDDNAIDAPTWYIDQDGDGYGDDNSAVTRCDPPKDAIDTSGDCDDGNPSSHPGGIEVCNDGSDNDCDGTVNDCVLPGRVTLPADADAEIDLGITACCGPFTAAGLGSVDGDDHAEVGFTAYGAYVLEGPLAATTSLDDDAISTVLDATHLVRAAGDIDGNGLSDLLTMNADTLVVHPGTLLPEPTPADGLARIELPYTLGATDTTHSEPADGAGDLDGDGSVDLVFGAYHEGAVYTVHGPLSGDYALPEDAGSVLSGSDVSDEAGRCVAGTGDLDGDGVDDLLVGEPDNDDAGTNWGAAFLLRGPLPAAMPLADADAVLLGEDSPRHLAGCGLAHGDLDGDGLADAVIGAAGLGDTPGAVYVVRGTTTGQLSLPAAAFFEVDGSALDTSDGLATPHSLSADGDMNGDGIDELALGLDGRDVDGVPGAGMVVVFVGPLAGSRQATDGDMVLVGTEANGAVGLPTDIVGDTDGDGYADLLVAAPWPTSRAWLIGGVGW